MPRKKCVICSYNFDKDFPYDFPDEWKLCCSCLATADTIAKKSLDNLKEYYNWMFNCDEKVKVSVIERAEKINELITLNHEV